LANINAKTMSWQTFFDRVKADKYNSLDGRLQVLRCSALLFNKYTSLYRMCLEDRQKIGGFRKDKATDWFWFGRMPTPKFKQQIKELPISTALDLIPLSGVIARPDYIAFIDRWLAAFVDESGNGTGHGLATATRLLTMKRPDYFVCWNKKNCAGLSKDFGVGPLDRHDYNRYWDELVQRITDTSWWKSARPSPENERGVWDGRAAFLDSLYYDEA
jgi:hypothetical protein